MENKNISVPTRKNFIEPGEIFFWTATIHKWHKLLWAKAYILDSLQHLSNIGKLDVFAFVIMPNHIHLIWRINEKNGKETTQGSFLKFTAHEFKKLLRNDVNNQLSSYAVNAANKCYEFWQRDGNTSVFAQSSISKVTIYSC